MAQTMHLDGAALTPVVRQALAEDIGSGDRTTTAVVPEELQASAVIRVREPATIAGMPVARAVFKELDPDLTFDERLGDGRLVVAGDVLATVTGSARAILSGERVALNFLQRLSGIATVTAACVQALDGSRTRILDTRKTTPGLRFLEKYAVVAGGGTNHRFGLFDQVMIKDNHLIMAAMEGDGAVRRAVERSRKAWPDMEVQVEVDTLDQLEEALDVRCDAVLLDNMSDDELAEAVHIRDRIHAGTRLEASGGMTPARISEIANIGLDAISVGALTHSAPAIDIGMDPV